MSTNEKVAGIIGGMGPESTADLFLRIIRATPVQRDQDHLHILIDNNPKLPDRMEAIFSGQTQPVLDALTQMAQRLAQAGAQVLAAPCNTAHYFLPEVRKRVDVPILDMLDEVCTHVAAAGIRRVGLLATTATIRTRLYASRLEAKRVGLLVPCPHDQDAAMRIIHEVKRVGVTAQGQEIARRLAEQLVAAGAQAIIPGCTEFSLVVADVELAAPVVDPLDALAQAVVRECLGQAV